MLLFVIVTAALALTCAMFATRNQMLGFPCVIFWGILSGYCYQASTVTWDIYYLLFFASAGMAIFSALAMYGLRDRDLSGSDADRGAFIDEGRDVAGRGERTSAVDENGNEITPPSRRVTALRDRAARRRER